MSKPEHKNRFTWLHLFALHAAVTALFVQFLPHVPPRLSVEPIVQLGGTIEVDDHGVPTHIYFLNCKFDPTQLAVLRNYPSIRMLDFWSCSGVTDDSLAALKQFDNLEVLILSEVPITDAGLRHLAELKNLRHLSLSNTQITDAGLAYLKQLPHLEKLVLEDTAVTDAGLAQLAACKNLKSLSLVRTTVSDECVQQLRAALPETCIFV